MNSIKKSYIKKCISELAKITDKKNPFSRIVFSKEYYLAREWLRNQFKILDLETRIDYGGNLIGTYKSNIKNAKKIIIGSHLDTVPNGGRFDGVAGIISALLIVRNFNERGVKFPFDIDVYDYLGEELNEWNISCIGSRAATGNLNNSVLKRKDQKGRILMDEINKIGGNANKIKKNNIFLENIIGCFELHIEQGAILEKKNIDIGIVKSIPNISRHKILINGKAGHSGTTLMDDRKDSLLIGSDLHLFINKLALEYSKRENRHFVATIGKISNFPNSATIISSQTELILDLRVVNDRSRKEFLKKVENRIHNLVKKSGIKIDFTEISFSPYVETNRNLNKLIINVLNKNKISYIDMDSGAGHDTANLSRVLPATMIFVPCKNGLSHCPEEYANIIDIEKGSLVIENCIYDIAEKF